MADEGAISLCSHKGIPQDMAGMILSEGETGSFFKEMLDALDFHAVGQGAVKCARVGRKTIS